MDGRRSLRSQVWGGVNTLTGGKKNHHTLNLIGHYKALFRDSSATEPECKQWLSMDKSEKRAMNSHHRCACTQEVEMTTVRACCRWGWWDRAAGSHRHRCTAVRCPWARNSWWFLCSLACCSVPYQASHSLENSWRERIFNGIKFPKYTSAKRTVWTSPSCNNKWRNFHKTRNQQILIITYGAFEKYSSLDTTSNTSSSQRSSLMAEVGAREVWM